MKETTTSIMGHCGKALVEVSDVPENVMYEGLEWEATTHLIEMKGTRQGLCYVQTYPRVYIKDGKDYFTTRVTYEESASRVSKEGMRHPTTTEAFSVIIDGLEGKLTGTSMELYEDIVKESAVGWTGCAFELEGDTLKVYTGVRGIKPGKEPCEYEKTEQFSYDTVKEYDVGAVIRKHKLSPKCGAPLGEFPEELIIDMYGRTLAELPVEMREGSEELGIPPAQIKLPHKRGGIFPVCIGSTIGIASISVEPYSYSRGVRDTP